jgi:hypothetical protein
VEGDGGEVREEEKIAASRQGRTGELFFLSCEADGASDELWIG